MLMTLGGVYIEVCFAHFILGGSGGIHPEEVFELLGRVVFKLIIHKRWQPEFQGGARFWQGGWGE